MSAAGAVQAAVAAALVPVVRLCDAPPRDAAWPFAVVSDGIASDWSTKDRAGRELRFAIAIWDDPAEGARLAGLIAAAEAAVAAMPRALPGWRIASLVLLRSRIVRDPDGPWAGRIDWRVRVLAE